MTPGRKRLLRLGALAAVIVALFVLGSVTGLIEKVTVANLRALLESAGPAGMLIFVAVCAAGTLVHVPGFVFIAAAVLGYGRLWGGVLVFFAALVAVAVSFCVVRAVGGRALAEVERPFLKGLLAPLDRRPIRTVALLRTFFMISPPLNYALGLSQIGFRDFMIGSALGLVAPIAVMSYFFDYFFEAFFPR